MTSLCEGCKTQNPTNVAFCVKCGLPVARESLDLEGRQVGNYKLLEKIGGGGFGEVYKAEHTVLRNQFAIKILHPSLACDDQFVERFRHEAMVLAGLQHENIVQVVDFGQEDEVGFYLVMEWIEGKTLLQLRKRRRILPWGQIYALFSQLLDALQLAHEKGVVHRDMKPENLMLTKGSRGRSILKIVDFGIAKIISGSQQKDDPSDQEGMALGTPYYMSPEQAAGKMDLVDHRTDLYACGVILAETLTGRRLFRSKDPKEILRFQIEVEPPKLSQLNKRREYPESFQEIMDKALAKDPEERFSSASEFYNALSIAMDAEGIQPVEEDEPAPAPQGNLLAMALGNVDDIESNLGTDSDFRGQKDSSKQFAPGTHPFPEESKPLFSKIVIAVIVLLSIATFSFLFLSPKQASNQKRKLLSTSPLAPTKSSLHLKKETKAPQKAKSSKTLKIIAVPKKHKVSRRKKVLKKKRKIFRKRLQIKRTKKRARPSPPVVNWLKLITRPSRALIFVNGSLQGQTPFKLKVPQRKSVRIEIRKKGYMIKKIRWKSSRDQTKRIQLIEKLF